MCALFALCVLLLVLESGIRSTRFFWKNLSKVLIGNDEDYHIYMVGGSTSFGEPFGPKISVPKIVSYKFNEKIGDKEIKIVNLAWRGRELEHGYWRLFGSLYKNPGRNGVLFIYAGINDNVWKGQKDQATFFWRMIQRSVVLSKLTYLLRAGKRDLKNSPERYIYRMNKTIRLAKYYGLEVAVSTLVGNITEYGPDGNIGGSTDTYELYNKGRNLEAARKYPDAIDVFGKLLEKRFVNLKCLYYHLGRCHRGLGEYDTAREYFWKVVDLGGEIRPNRFQNGLIRELASANQIELVDSIRNFEQASENAMLGYDLFYDAHHPNLKGYLILAEGFADALSRLTKQEVKRPVVNESDLTGEFGFADSDYFNVYISRVLWLCANMTRAAEKSERIERARYYLEKANKINSGDSRIYLSEFLLAVMDYDVKTALNWIEEGELLTRNREVFEGRKWLLKLISDKGLPDNTLDVIRKNISIQEYN
ncbi:hypothetical protein ACFLTD_04725 [Elusimicrobiota bacterium]